MTLAPKLPPGRANRKALQFAADIHHLRDAGYTFSAIRQALLDAGISVGLSTIKREAARQAPRAVRTQRAGGPQGLPPHPADTPVAAGQMPAASAIVTPTPTGASGREIAEAFFKAHPSNPLLWTQESSP